MSDEMRGVEKLLLGALNDGRYEDARTVIVLFEAANELAKIAAAAITLGVEDAKRIEQLEAALVEEKKILDSYIQTTAKTINGVLNGVTALNMVLAAFPNIEHAFIKHCRRTKDKIKAIKYLRAKTGKEIKDVKDELERTWGSDWSTPLEE